MSGNKGFNTSIFGKLHTVHTKLTMKSAVGMRIIMTVIDHIIFIAFFQNAMMSRPMDCSIGIGFKNTSLIGVRPHRLVRSGILHPIGVVVTGTRRIHKIIDTVPFHHKGRFKKIRGFRIRNQTRFSKTLHIGSQFSGPATETFINPPSPPIQIYRTIIIHKGLSVQCNGIRHKTVGYKNSLTFAQYIFPRTARCFTDSAMNHTGLTIKIIIIPIRMFHHIRSPYPMTVRPVHRHQRPVYKILAGPHLCRTETGSTAIRSGIHIIRIAKLLHRGIGKISGNNGIPRTRSIKRLLSKACSSSQQ